MTLTFINNSTCSTINQLQIGFDCLFIFMKNFFDLGKSYILILFIFSLLYLIIFGYVENQHQLNLADRSQEKDQTTQEQDDSSQPNAQGSSNQPSTNDESGKSGTEANNEQQGNTNQNENTTGTQGTFIQPQAEEPTPGEEAGLSAYEEGLLTMFLNRSFKRNKQNRRR